MSDQSGAEDRHKNKFSKIADALRPALGKTVVNAFIAGNSEGRCSIYLVFDDETNYELYCHNLEGARKVWEGGVNEVRRSMSKAGADWYTVLIRTEEADTRLE